MRIGGCVGVNVEISKQLKIEYMEVSAMGIGLMSQEDFETLKEKIQSCPVKCEVANGLVAGDIRLTGDNADFKRLKEYAELTFKRLNEIGVKYLVFGSAKAKDVPEGFSREIAFTQIVKAGEIMSDIAKKYDQTVLVEPINPNFANIITSVSEGIELVNAVNKENFKMMVDFYHMLVSSDDFSLVEKYKDLILHVHIASPNLCVPKSEKDWEFVEKCFSLLKNTGYTGRISYEGFDDSIESYNQMYSKLILLANS